MTPRARRIVVLVALAAMIAATVIAQVLRL